MKELQEIVRNQVILAAGGAGPLAEQAIRTILSEIERRSLPADAIRLASGIRTDLSPLVRRSA